jgi:hypothetical protein
MSELTKSCLIASGEELVRGGGGVLRRGQGVQGVDP